MSSVQKLLTAIFPARWAQSMAADSRNWMICCACGFEKSIRDIGGIRWKARGTSKSYTKCPKCGQRTWHTTYWKAPGV